MPDTKELGEVLVDEGLITNDQLAQAAEEQQKVGRSLGRVLIDLGLIREADIVRMLARQVGLEFVDLSEYQVDPSAAALIPEAGRPAVPGHRHRPRGRQAGRGDVRPRRTCSPSTTSARSPASTSSPWWPTASDVEAAIRRYSRMDQAVEEIAPRRPRSRPRTAPWTSLSVGAAVEDGPIVKLVNLLITQAVNDRASDIHIEPTERDVRIRYRIDGVLHEVMRSPKNIQSGLVSRLKIMADINIAERRHPQDGRISLTVCGKRIDLRVATLPTVYGEKVVMRILDKSRCS